MKETKIIKTLTRNQANEYEGEVAGLVKMTSVGNQRISLWIAEKESVIADRYIVENDGYYIVATLDSMEVVNEYCFDNLVEAVRAFNDVLILIKR